MDPCITEIRRDLGIGSELKVFVDTCLERLKVICCWEDDRRKRVPVSVCVVIAGKPRLFEESYPSYNRYYSLTSLILWELVFEHA